MRDYDEAMSFLSSFTRSGAPVKDLSRFKRLMSRLGDPQEKLKCVHAAGTNGKGSVCEYISEGLTLSKFKTGKFTSPYINFIEERIQINNSPISKESFAKYILKVKENAGGEPYSQFEILNAAAFLCFLDEKCDYAVIETGIGGLLDSTNIIDPLVSVITTVDLDHCDILGKSLSEIAKHKAGIIKPSRPAVLAPFQKDEVKKIMANRAAETNSRLIIPDERGLEIIGADLNGCDFIYKGEKFHTKMCGRHQMINASAAIEVMRLLNLPEENIKKALENAAVPARMEKMKGGRIIIDGAHNPSGASAAAALFSKESGKKLLITGMLRSKDWRASLKILAPIFDNVTAVDFFAENAVPKEEICAFVKGLGISCAAAESAREALSLAEKGDFELKAVCGSLYLCGKMRELLI